MKWKVLVAGLALALITGSALAQNNSSENESEVLNGSNMTDGNMTDSNITDGETQTGSASVETVIVASSESAIDGTIADSASERLGVPIVLTDPENLSESTSQGMTELGVEQAVIIGGPAAISDDVEDEIDSLTSQETERVFGQTASDTSVEVAEYFWPEGYNQTSIVQADLLGDQEETYDVLSAVVNTAGDNPVLLSDLNESSEEVLSEVESQNVQEVAVYSLGNTTDNSLETGLNDLDASSEFNQGSTEELTETLYSEIQDNPEDQELYALAGDSFSFGIPTYAAPDAATYTVTEDTVNQSVEFIGASGFEAVTAIGQEDIGQEITGGLNETAVETSYIRGDDPAQVSVDLLSNNSQEWSTQRNDTLIQEILGTTTTTPGNETETPTENDTTENDTQTPTETENETETSDENLTPENEGETVLPDNETNQTETPENDTEDNQTETPAENDTAPETGDAQSSLELTSDTSSVSGQATYTGEVEYDEQTDVQQNESTITFVFSLEPVDGDQTQEEYNYEFSEDVNPEPGSYDTRAVLVVDGETVDTATGEAQIQ